MVQASISAAVRTAAAALREGGPPILSDRYWDPGVPVRRKDGTVTRGALLPRVQEPAGEHKESETDPHVLGRAIDIVLRSSRVPRDGNAVEERLGDQIVAVFLAQRAAMKWSAVIYNRRQWDGAGVESPRVFNAAVKQAILAKRRQQAEARARREGLDPAGVTINESVDPVAWEHLTHIHIEWSSANAAETAFGPALVAALRAGTDQLEF